MSAVERQRHPAAFSKRALDGVDDFLNPRAVAEVALVAGGVAPDLRDEARYQVGVEQRAPRFPRAAARRVEAIRHGHVSEFDLAGSCRLQRFAAPQLLAQPADVRPLAAVEASLDAGVVADGHEARLDSAEWPVRETSE